MKILHVIQRYSPAIGGSESWCQAVARYAQRRGCQVRVFTMQATSVREYAAELPLGERTMHLGRLSLDEGVEVHRFPCTVTLPTQRTYKLFQWLEAGMRVFLYPPHSLTLYRALARAARWADVVHLHTLPYTHVVVGYAWARLARKPIVVTPHFHIGHPHFEGWLFYALLRRCHRVLVMTDRERSHLIAHGVSPKRLVVTGDGVDPAQYESNPPAHQAERSPAEIMLPASDQRMVLFLGRKEQYKGIPTLLQAFAQIRRDHPGIVLCLVGHGTEWFRQFWRRCPGDVRERVVELDGVSHELKAQLLRRASVVVMPSRYEAFGIVVLESWMCGAPVVVPEHSALADVTSDGGLTFRLDDAEDLARQLRRLLDDPGLARVLAERGRARALARYTWDRIGELTLRACHDVRRRRRVLSVSHLYPPDAIGGSEAVAFQEAEALRGQGQEVRVFCGRIRNEEPRYALATPIDSPVVRINLHDADFDHLVNRSLDRRPMERQMARCLDAFQPDLVHFHNIFALSARLIQVCRTRRIPLVMTLHDYWPLCNRITMLTTGDRLCQHNGLSCLACQRTVFETDPVLLPVRNTLIKLSLRYVDRFIAPSRYLAERFIAHGFPRERVAVIPNGIEVESFRVGKRQHRQGRREVVFGYLGYLGMHKGAEHLLRALGKMTMPDRAQVWIGGTGNHPYEAYLHALCHQLKISSRVRFLGSIPHHRVANWYRQIDVLVLPSIWPENHPLTVLEAMASGVPVIASDVGGVPEIIRHGETGWLIPRADADALAQVMERFINDAPLRARIGRQAARDVRLLASPSEHLAAVKRVHEQVLAEEPAPPVSFELVVCAGFNGRDPALETLLGLWRSYVEMTGRDLPDVCEVRHLADGELREAKVLVVPEWHVRFADEIERVVRCGVPILGSPLQRPVRWLPRAASVRTYRTHEEFTQQLSEILRPDEPAVVEHTEERVECLTA